MTYVVYFANAAIPATGLPLTWEYLKLVSTGADYGSPPSFAEIGGGWYKFTYSDTDELVGVVDGSATLDNVDRYVPLYLTVDDDFPQAVWQHDNRTLGNA